MQPNTICYRYLSCQHFLQILSYRIIMFYTGNARNTHIYIYSISKFTIKINRLKSVFFMKIDTKRTAFFYIFDK